MIFIRPCSTLIVRGSDDIDSVLLAERSSTGRRRSEHAARREAGKRVKRFTASSSCRAIRDERNSDGGACRDGKLRSWVLLAAGATVYERKELSRGAERRRMAGTPATREVRLKPDTTYKREPGLKIKTGLHPRRVGRPASIPESTHPR